MKKLQEIKTLAGYSKSLPEEFADQLSSQKDEKKD